jgi:zinc protease
MTLRRFLLTLAAVALPVGALAAPAQAQPRASGGAGGVPPIHFESFTLENGLRVLVHEDHSTPIVAVNLWYDVGAAHDPPGRSGFAHLFEHMLFQQTEHLPPGTFMSIVQGAGGVLDATTALDRTNYYQILPSNRVNLALWLEAERMARLVVDSANFTREREVVKEERRMRIDNQPYGQALLALDSIAMDWAPYKRPAIGSMEDLDAATPADARAFYEAYYGPNNATLVVAGAVGTAQVRQLVEEYFRAIPRGAEPPPLPPLPATPRTDGERRVTMAAPLATLPLLISGYNIPPRNHDDTYALQLLNRIFSQGESSRLHERLVRQEGAALAAFSILNNRKGPGTVIFGVLPNQGVPVERVEALLHEEIQRLQRDGVTPVELQKAKNQLRTALVSERLRVAGRAEALQEARLYLGDPAEVDRVLDRFDAVTGQQIRDVARRYLTAANRTTIVAAPPAVAGAGQE